MRKGLKYLKHSAQGLLCLKRSALGLLCLKRSALGFTLAELLIALAIMGVIATFTIPKILQSQQDGRKVAIFKEDFAAINQIMYALIREGLFAVGKPSCGGGSAAFNRADFRARINALRIEMGVTDGIYLSNGSKIMLREGDAIDFTVDYNGDAAPNTLGEDRVLIFFNHAAIICHNIPPSRFGANWSTALGAEQPANTALYQSIFSGD